MRLHYSILKFCLLIIVITNNSFAGYREFSSEIRLAQKEFIAKNYKESLGKYISTLEKFNYPYVKETMQAAYVASFVGDKVQFTNLLEQAINLGLNESEFNSLFTEWKKLNPDQLILFDFQKYRVAYLQKLNWDKTAAFYKLDVYRSYITKTYPLSESNHTAYYEQMNLLRDRYIKLVGIYGYVSDKDSGRRFETKVEKCKTKASEKSTCLNLSNDPFMPEYFKEKCLKVTSESKTSIWSSSDPGAWFLSHYINSENINQVDSTFFRLIQGGLDELKASPFLLVNMLESSRLLENDLALTYYSRVWLGLKMSYSDKYNMDAVQKNTINASREKYGFRSLEEEEELLRHLYFIKTKKKLPESFSNSELDAISFENRIFIQIMV